MRRIAAALVVFVAASQVVNLAVSRDLLTMTVQERELDTVRTLSNLVQARTGSSAGGLELGSAAEVAFGHALHDRAMECSLAVDHATS